MLRGIPAVCERFFAASQLRDLLFTKYSAVARAARKKPFVAKHW